MKILYADDDPAFLTLIGDILSVEGHQTLLAKDGQQALDLFFSYNDIGLVILDVMMPFYSGWEVLDEIRTHSAVPIMMLTALDDEPSEIKGLKRGADEYIAKPFSYEVFMARVHALLRRNQLPKEETLTAGRLTMDQAAQRVCANGKDILLTHKEYELLALLMRNPRMVFSRETLLDRVWGFDFEGDQRTVDTHVKTLRSKLLSCGSYIQTVRGSGYKLEATNESLRKITRLSP